MVIVREKFELIVEPKGGKEGKELKKKQTNSWK